MRCWYDAEVTNDLPRRKRKNIPKIQTRYLAMFSEDSPERRMIAIGGTQVMYAVGYGKHMTSSVN